MTITYPIRPKVRSLITGQVADLFGLHDDEPPLVVAQDFDLRVQPGQIVLFTGPSGSGKSSLLRAVAPTVNAVDAMSLLLPEVPLVEALRGTLEERLKRLAICGLAEARLLLRTPSELSDGQRYRFRIAYASQQGLPIMLDEFTAHLDRTLAKVVSFNLRKHNIPLLAATTHEDIAYDLNPDLHVRCHGDGVIDLHEGTEAKRPFSLAKELTIADGSMKDWSHFQKWHYRSHHLAFVRKVVLMKHADEPIGICVFAAPAASLKLRSQYFGLTNARSRLAMTALNTQLWLLSRVVLHPTWRGAGIAA